MFHLLRIAENKITGNWIYNGIEPFPWGFWISYVLAGSAGLWPIVNNRCLWLHHFSHYTITGGTLHRGKVPVA